MADTSWTCSGCGTSNEPGSRACAGCGRWPSVFDLEGSGSRYRTDQETAAGQDVFDVVGDETDAEPEVEDEPEEKRFPWGPVLTFAIAAVFVLISWLSDQFGS